MVGYGCTMLGFLKQKHVFGPNRLTTPQAGSERFGKVDEEIGWPFAMEHV
jgi:hypothetical protein